VVHALIDLLSKPEFLWRPRQLLRSRRFEPCDTLQHLPLPWDCTIFARSTEVVGRLIATLGLYDLPLTEAIMRLAVAGDTALDIGANIGYTALVFARSVRAEGSVRAFEPNRFVLPTLRKNVSEWSSLRIAPIEVETIALSDRDGEAILGFPDGYADNEGIASLELSKDGIPVSVRRLESFDFGDVGIMKIDVEGHEAAVLCGATGLLQRKAIRDILFEEHGVYPARSHQILLDHGYSIFRVTGSRFGPLLLPPQAEARQPFLPPEYPPNYLATIDPSRAKARFKVRGWQALSPRLRKYPNM
jgi:FkbM family methyltransferase